MRRDEAAREYRLAFTLDEEEDAIKALFDLLEFKIDHVSGRCCAVALNGGLSELVKMKRKCCGCDTEQCLLLSSPSSVVVIHNRRSCSLSLASTLDQEHCVHQLKKYSGWKLDPSH